MMNRQNLTITGLVVALVSVIAVAGLMFNESEADLTAAEVYTHIQQYGVNNPHLVVSEAQFNDAVDDINERIDDLEDALAHPHTEFTSIQTSLNTIRSDITDLERGQNDTPTNTLDFGLESCEDFNCTDETSRFNAGDVIYVSGHNPSNDRSLEYKLYDPDNVRIDSRNVSLQPNGPFIIAIQTDTDFETGTYRVLVEIDNDTDVINFIIN